MAGPAHCSQCLLFPCCCPSAYCRWHRIYTPSLHWRHRGSALLRCTGAFVCCIVYLHHLVAFIAAGKVVNGSVVATVEQSFTTERKDVSHNVILIGGGEMIVKLAVFEITGSCKTRHSGFGVERSKIMHVIIYLLIRSFD